MTAGRTYALSYFDRPGSGPTILYVHGLGCSKADFMEMTSVPELQAFRLVGADIPGCGDSSYDENQPLNVDGVVELIEDLPPGLAHALGLRHFGIVRACLTDHFPEQTSVSGIVLDQ